jgi:3',5'-nucleoside bisphosphate phosphatase
MNEFRADLHCHSTCSDGTDSPAEILKKAVELGLSGLSITDHDTIDAYGQAIPLAKELGIELISGVEFSASLDDISVHILAYAFPLDNPLIQDFCARHKQRRNDRNREILKRLNEHGMPLTDEEVMEVVSQTPADVQHSIGRPHIALAMLNKGYIQNIQEAFTKYLAEGKSCYAPGEIFSVQETLDIIHKAQGFAIIAHPHLINHSKILKQLLEMNFDGIECYYARFGAESQQRWLKIAEHRHWMITGGSDYHGSIKPNIPLGASWVNEEYFRHLQKHFKEVSQPNG